MVRLLGSFIFIIKMVSWCLIFYVKQNLKFIKSPVCSYMKIFRNLIHTYIDLAGNLAAALHTVGDICAGVSLQSGDRNRSLYDRLTSLRRVHLLHDVGKDKTNCHQTINIMRCNFLLILFYSHYYVLFITGRLEGGCLDGYYSNGDDVRCSNCRCYTRNCESWRDNGSVETKRR